MLYSSFTIVEPEVIYWNMTNMTMCTSSGRDFNDVPYFTVGLARTLPGGRAFREGELPGGQPHQLRDRRVGGGRKADAKGELN